MQIPSPLDVLRYRRFALFPPILASDLVALGPNEWLLGLSTWAEVQVINAENGQSVWLPRAWVGGVSECEDLLPVVELISELAHNGTTLVPCGRAVIEMPPCDDSNGHGAILSSLERKSQSAPVVAIRLSLNEMHADRRSRLLAGTITFCLVTAILAAALRP